MQINFSTNLGKSMRTIDRRVAAYACAIGVTAVALTVNAAEMKVLHVFGKGHDADRPSAPMIADAAGNLYGSTPFGGANGAGTVYKLTPPHDGSGIWTEQVLFDFAAENALHQSTTGSAPRSALWFGAQEALFGTTSSGSPVGAGNVFQLMPPASGLAPWTQSVVHTFQSGAADGGFPEGAAVPVGVDGTRFGTTLGGGPTNQGAIYSIRPPAAAGGDWEESLVATFSGDPEGGEPINDLVADAAGNLYGTTTNGGAFNWGTVFQLAPPKVPGGSWTSSVIYSFHGGRDGRAPGNQLAIDKRGALWGTNAAGGRGKKGNIFLLAPPAGANSAWTFQVVHDFMDDGPQGGVAPGAGLVSDGNHAFYGTTGVGGAAGCGTVFRFVPAFDGKKGTLTTLHSFTGSGRGAFPSGNLLIRNGLLFGTTFGSDDSDGNACNGASIAFQVAP